jgi:hypothetical protein
MPFRLVILLYLLAHFDKFRVSVATASSPTTIASGKTTMVAATVTNVRSAVVLEFVFVLTGHN